MRISDWSSDVCSSDLKGCIMTTATTAGRAPAKLPWWTPGDWNAFFGFGTNILVNVLVLTGLLRFVLKLPDPIIFGRILPAVGDRKSGVSGKRVSGRVDSVGRRLCKTKKKKRQK